MARMIENHYILTALLLLGSSVMAFQQNSTCARYGFDINYPGFSCADIYGKNPASRGKFRSGNYVI